MVVISRLYSLEPISYIHRQNSTSKLSLDLSHNLVNQVVLGDPNAEVDS